jgi:guanylate kinase
MNKGLLIILSGPSGVGKGTVRKVLMEDRSLDLAYSISMTTRKPRDGEKEGLDYFFVSKEHFEEAIKNDELLEYARFVDNYYGTPKKYVEELRNNGKNVLLEIETDGARQVIAKMKGPSEISIFLLPPNMGELRKRIEGRHTECNEVICERMDKAEREVCLASLYDYRVINDIPTKAAEEIADIIKERLRILKRE